eukprot:7944481-Pyramimonas_sp.AAC.1
MSIQIISRAQRGPLASSNSDLHGVNPTVAPPQRALARALAFWRPKDLQEASLCCPIPIHTQHT